MVNAGTAVTGDTQITTLPGILHSVGAVGAAVEIRDGTSSGVLRWVQAADANSGPIEITIGSAIHVSVTAGTASLAYVSS